MKRTGNLYTKVVSRESLYQAFHDAVKNKHQTNSCFQFEKRLAFNIEQLHIELLNYTYKPKPYYKFVVYEPKPREISAPSFQDRIVQHAIYNVIQPLFDKTFIDQSFACRQGKGTHLASNYVQSSLQKVPRNSYVLQLDIRKYYASIDRAILKSLIERKIKDKQLIRLIMLFAVTDSPTGTPIGNLLSQLFGLIYMNPIDHFIKRVLKVKCYARYVDDFVLIGLTRQQAVDYKTLIIKFLKENLELSLSKSSIYRVTKGVNFVGFRTWKSKRFVRKHALYTFRKNVKKDKVDSVISCLGHASKTASLQYMLNYMKDNKIELYNKLPKRLKRKRYLKQPKKDLIYE